MYFKNKWFFAILFLISLRFSDQLEQKVNGLDLNQFILFSIGDKEGFKPLINHEPYYYKQYLNQTTVNYCNFDPNHRSDKTKPTFDKTQFDKSSSTNGQSVINIISKGNTFNEKSKIDGNKKSNYFI
jgi:hypothetical protein